VLLQGFYRGIGQRAWCIFQPASAMFQPASVTHAQLVLSAAGAIQGVLPRAEPPSLGPFEAIG
jgi:hypothetical protein